MTTAETAQNKYLGAVFFALIEDLQESFRRLIDVN